MTQLKLLKLALLLFGTFFVLGILPMMMLWPEGWAWEPRQHEYEQMILGVYATLGIFLILAAKNPLQHRSLIQFTIWSSIVHATIMLLQALHDETEHANLMGDVPALYAVAVILFVLLPKKESSNE